LKGIVSRISFDRVERKLNSHDIAAMPILIKPLLGNTLADAVVQPQSEAELVELVKWANQNRVALTPRAKATSGYGGVLPVKQGVVVDFYFLRSVLAIDVDEMTVTTQPGISWEQLDRELKKKGLTLRVYPSSYPSATVGGWLAQGGAGFGSFEYGFFVDNVISARVVLPNGEVRQFQGGDLEMISEACGITGFISEVTLRIQKLEPLDVFSVGCKHHECFQMFLERLIEAQLPIWSVLFINPKMAELKNEAPPQMHNGHPVGVHVELPKEYIITITARQKDSQMVRERVEGILEGLHARILSQEIADHEWENRFKIMVVKRLGPSLVPAEVVVPLRNLAKALAEITKKVDLPIVKEGVLIQDGRDGEPEVVILGFIPSDQRKIGYNFAFGLSLSVAKIAEKYGGREYSTGLYFTKKVNDVLGKDRVQRLRKFKAQVDPNDVMNPGKVLGNGLVGTFLSLASTFEPLIRPLGNAVEVDVGERIKKDVRDIPADVVWYSYACSQCGYCVDECDQFYGRGWESQSPRGKWYWLREHIEGRENWDQKMVDTFLVCTTCELCNDRCSAVLPIESSWMKLRGQLINEEKRMTFPPFSMMEEATKSQGDIWAGYRKDRDQWFPEDLKEKHYTDKADAVYFGGCTVSYVEHDIGIASVRLLDAANVDFSYTGKAESCCGTPMLVAGLWDTFAKVMKSNIAAVKAKGASTVITSCPACDMMWRHVYPEWAKKLGIEYDIQSKHYSEVIAEQIKNGEFKFPENTLPEQTVTWHDSCHIGRVSGVYEPPRDLIKAVPNVNFVEMEHNHEEAHCCGSVLTLIKEPPIAADIGEMRLNEAVEAGAEKLLALCPCCEFQLRVSADKKKTPIQVEDLASFTMKALGYDGLPDPHPEVQVQWAVFEAMIALMTPQGFADLMDTMWPELIDAMPLGMGKMMTFMGKRTPWALGMMKPMFPVLFPMLLPGMMPKVMSTMLDRVAARIPMPDYMAEQMPELMPKVMDNLMPHMIGDLVPLVTDPMINYLKSNRKNGKPEEPKYATRE
jgi:Fe-S oxidoreductase/FAD/FMN-containing dehydrogenase